MLSIILSWLFITYIAFIQGVFSIKNLCRFFKIEAKLNDLHFIIVCISGLAIISFYAFLWHFFFYINIEFLIFLLIITITQTFFYRKSLGAYIQLCKKNIINTNFLLFPVFISSILIIAYFSLPVTSHADEGSYFLPSVHWMQQYKIIIGLGNLHSRLAFNSSWHLLSAVFSFPFVSKGYFNDLNGLIYLYCLLYALNGLNRIYKGETSFINYLKTIFFLPVLALYFGAADEILLIPTNFIGSMTSDLPALLFVCLIGITFVEKINNNALGFDIKSLVIILLSVFVITIKLSTTPLALLSIYLFFREVFSKKYLFSSKIALFPIIFILPWIVRNILLSGYIVFPFSQLNILSVDWKVPFVRTLIYQKLVKSWAIEPTLNWDIGWLMPMSEVFPIFYAKLSFIQTVIINNVFLAVFLTFCYIVYGVLKRKFQNDTYKSYLILAITYLIGIIFWFYSAPDIRFGLGFILFCSIFLIGLLFHWATKDFYKYFSAIILLIYLGINGIYYRNIYKIIYDNAEKNLLVIPERPIPQIPTQTYLISNKLKVNVVESSCSFVDLPCITIHEKVDLLMRGNTIEEGLKPADPDKKDFYEEWKW